MTEEYNTIERVTALSEIENIFEKLVALYSPKIVGEQNNIKFLYCVAISKDLPRDYRLHAIIQSQSSAGKSNLVNTILSAFSDSVLDYTEFTNAYLNRSQSNYDGYIFKLEQMEKTNQDRQLTLGNLKPLLSEGKLRIGLVDKDNKGKNQSKLLEVDGIPVFITTSTKYNIDQEALNRTFQMQIDESQEQTKRVIRHTLNQYGKINFDNAWNDNLTELIDITKTYSAIASQFKVIAIPFAEKLMDIIPSANITMRRDLAKILNLTCVIAFLNFHKRKKIPTGEKGHFYDNLEAKPMNYWILLAGTEDFFQAMKIGGETIQQTLNKLNEPATRIYNVAQGLLTSHTEEGITNKQIAEATGLSQNRVGEITKHLYEMGYFTRKR